MRIMPVKPVTHNKYSDMKRYTWIWIMLSALLSGCEDDFDKGGSNPGEGVTEGMITFRFSTEEAPVIVTRVGETGQQESLENVLVMVFDKDGKLVNKAYQQLTIDNHSVNIDRRGGSIHLCLVQFAGRRRDGRFDQQLSGHFDWVEGEIYHDPNSGRSLWRQTHHDRLPPVGTDHDRPVEKGIHHPG